MVVMSVPAKWMEQDDQQPSPYHFYDHHHRQPHTSTQRAIIIKQEYQPQKQHYFHSSSKELDVTFQGENNHSLSTKDYCEIFTKISDNPALYKCKLCEKTVTNRWHHASIHKPQYNKCPECHQLFTRKDNMKAHMRLKHGMFRPIVI
ncbi:hypothetical protein Trydic_g6614 [Trypoxylus dichotomus]